MSREELGDLGIYLVAVVGTSLLCHTDTTVGLKRSLERLIGLETYDGLLALVKISGAMRSNGRNNLGVHIENAACFSFLLLKIQYHSPKILGVLGRASQEGIITVIGMIVSLDEVTHVDFLVPFATYKICFNWFHFENTSSKIELV